MKNQQKIRCTLDDIQVKAQQLESLLMVLTDANITNYKHGNLEAYISCCEALAREIRNKAEPPCK